MLWLLEAALAMCATAPQIDNNAARAPAVLRVELGRWLHDSERLEAVERAIEQLRAASRPMMPAGAGKAREDSMRRAFLAVACVTDPYHRKHVFAKHAIEVERSPKRRVSRREKPRHVLPVFRI